MARTVIRNTLQDIAKNVPSDDDVALYYPLRKIAKILQCDQETVRAYVYQNRDRLQIFRLTDSTIVLNERDAQACIASRSNDHNANVLVDEPAVSHPPDQSMGKTDVCGACGRRSNSVSGDIDDITHRRHGYLCPRCLRLVQAHRRRPKVLRDVLSYIERDILIKK